MKKYYFILIACCFLVQSAFSQILYELQIKQGENYPTCIFNTDRDETIAGLYFSDAPYKLIKINKAGSIVDSLVFDMEGYTSVSVDNIIHAERPNRYLALIKKEVENYYYNSKYHIVLSEFDDDFNIIWEKTIDTIIGRMYSMGGQFLNGDYYVYVAEMPSEVKSHFYKISTEGDVIHSSTHQNAPVRFMTQIPHTNSFIINKYELDLDLDILSANLEIDTSFGYSGSVVIYPNLEFINDSMFVTSGMWQIDYKPWGYYQEWIAIKSTHLKKLLSNPYTPSKRTVFGAEGIGDHWGVGCRGGEKNALAMYDDYFFFAGTGRFNNGYGPLFDRTDNFIMLYAFDHNLDSLWGIHLGYDAYYLAYSIAPTPDGGCVVIAYRYDWRGSGNIESYIVRIAKDFEVSIPQIEKPKPLTTIFPNPGNHRFYIQTECNNFTFRLYDLQGRLLLTQQNQKEVDTRVLPDGCYIYQMVDENGTASGGKWVKKH